MESGDISVQLYSNIVDKRRGYFQVPESKAIRSEHPALAIDFCSIYIYEAIRPVFILRNKLFLSVRAIQFHRQGPWAELALHESGPRILY
jgi:hypothetical protein